MSISEGERRDIVLPHLFLLTTMAFFGSAFASSKFVVGEIPHEVAAVLRFGGGAIVLLLLVLVLRNRRQEFRRRDLMRAGAVGLLGVFAYNYFFFWGLSYAPSLDGVIIVPVLSPVLTTIFLVVTGKERLSRYRGIGLALGVAGAVLFFIGVGGGVGGVGARLLGDGIYLLGAVSWAAYSIASKKVLVGVDPLRATTYGTVVGATALLIAAVPALPDMDWSAVSGTAWVNVGYLAIGPTAVAYLCYYAGLRRVGPSTATIMMFAVPVFGTICSVVFLNETFTVIQFLGSVVMIAGAVLAVTEGRLRASQPPGGGNITAASVDMNKKDDSLIQK